MNEYFFNALMEALDAAKEWDLKYVLRVHEAARYIGISASTLRRLHNEGEIPGVYITDSPRGVLGFRRKDLEAYVDYRVSA